MTDDTPSAEVSMSNRLFVGSLTDAVHLALLCDFFQRGQKVNLLHSFINRESKTDWNLTIENKD